MEKRFGVLVIFLVSVLFISSCDLEKAKMSPDVPFVVNEVVLEDRWCGTGETEYCDHGEYYQIVLSYDTTGGHTGDYLTFYFTLANDDGCEIFSHDGFMIDFHSYGTDGFRDQVSYHDCAFGERIFISEAYLKDGADGEIVQVLTSDQLSGEFLLGVPGYRCGNGNCEMYGEGSFGEHCLNCPLDCGECDGADPCGDGDCSEDEDCESCPFDCGECDGEGSDCYDDCSIDGCEGEPCGDEGYVCDEGTCELICDDLETQCNGACVDTMIDENHCGDCTIYCSAGQECILGICEEEFPLPFGGCVLGNAFWEFDENDDEFRVGEIVSLTVEGSSACLGDTLSFEVFEEDGIFEDDPVIYNPESVNFALEIDDEVGWSDVYTGVEENLLGVWGSSENDVYIVSGIDEGRITHYDGNSWEYVGSNVKLPSIRGIWGSSADNIYVVGRAYIEDTNPDPMIWNGVFRQEGIYHFDGVSWKEEDMLDFKYPLDEIWGSSADDVYVTATQDKTVFHYDGNSWEILEMGASNHRFKSIWGSSANDVYLGGLHSTNPTGGNPTGSIFHFDGTTWEEVVRNNYWNYFKDMWGSSADNIYAVGPGNAGKVLHYNGVSWEEEVVDPNMPGNKYFIGVWGSSANDVYVVGKPGSNFGLHSNVYHYDGVSWERVNTETDYNLIEIWGSSSEDIYAIGWDGKILHYGITPHIIAEGSWLTETQRDMFGSPEYYFISSLSTSSIDSVDLLREE